MQVTPSQGEVAAGRVIGGRYRLGALLGSGGMADVYDAVDLRLQRPVAVKLLRPEMAVRDDIRLRFQVEARAAAGLSHPNAVAVFDTGEHEGVPFLVMERLPGESLADRLLDGPVETAWLCQAATGVLGALALAHAAGIVHRDVKPGNVLLASDGTAKITDFGIAKSLGTGGGASDLTRTGQLVGTPAYLAPERLDGHPAGPQSDLFALGVVLYEALAGRKPFVGDTPLAVAQAVADGDHVPLGSVRPDLDPRLVAAVERALARDPGDRFASAEEMAMALSGRTPDPTLDAFPAGVPEGEGGTMVLPGATVTAAGRPGGLVAARRQRTLLLAGAALVLLLLLVLARADRGTVSPAAGGGPDTTVAAATPEQGLAASLRALADGLTTDKDGARAGHLATGLRNVADEVEAGGGGPEATALLVSVAQWHQTGQLTSAATVSAVDLLRQVPGVGQTAGVSSPSVSTAPPATNSPAIVVDDDDDEDDGGGAVRGEGGGKGKGKGKD